MAALADEQRGDFGSIQNCAAANGESNSGANEEAAKDCGQQFVGCDIRKFYERETEGQAGNCQGASNSKGFPNLAIAERDKWKINLDVAFLYRPGSRHFTIQASIAVY